MVAQKPCTCALDYCPQCNLPVCRPNRPLTFADGVLQSTYKHDYDEKKGPKQGLCGLAAKDKMLVPGGGKFGGASTMHTDFPPKQGARSKGHGPIGEPFPYRPFDDRTTYNTYHNGKQGPPADGRRKAPLLDSAPFCGQTTNKADFIDWGPQPPAPRKPDGVPLDVPFLGTSTYSDDYTKKPLPPRNLRQPPPLLPSKNRANYTTYGEDFIGHPFSTRAQGLCCDDVRHTGSYRHNHVHGDVLSASAPTALFGTTTHRLYKL